MVKRKTDPMAQAIRDLRYLPRVLEALKALRAKDAEVMALVGGVGGHGVGTDFRSAHPMADMPPHMVERLRVSQLARGCAHNSLPMGADCGVCGMRGVGGPALTSVLLATAERQEYETAKKAGKTIPAPDPFEGQQVSEAQRERMARQKAWLESQGRAVGPPPPLAGKVQVVDQMVEAGLLEGVRTEELTTVSDGTAPVPTDDEVH